MTFLIILACSLGYITVGCLTLILVGIVFYNDALKFEELEVFDFWPIILWPLFLPAALLFEMSKGILYLIYKLIYVIKGE